MTDQIRFDLIEIAQTIRRRARFIIVLTLVAGAAAAAAWLIGKRKYKATASALVNNPLYSDRNNLFRNDKVTFVEYFGREDDVDKVLAIAKSDATRGAIVDYMQLAKTYKLDTSKEEDRAELASRFKTSFDVRRTEYSNIDVSYTDPDPKLAADVSNNALRIIDEIYTGHYNSLRINAGRSLEGRMRKTDSIIASLTDSLASMRDHYHIYDVMSPSRQTVSVGGAHGGGAGYGRAIEEIQNIEATKDQLVSDRARLVSLINEFNTGVSVGDQPQLQVISPASAPDKPSGLSLPLTVLAAMLIVAFVTTAWALLSSYFRILTTRLRNNV